MNRWRHATTIDDPARALIGQRIEALCFERDMTFNDLATTLGLNRTTLYKWRTPKYVLPGSIVALIAIADTYGVSVDWLLGRTNQRKPA